LKTRKSTTNTMTNVLRLGDIVPDFEADSTQGKIKFHEWAGNSWVILFSHPADYTPVCTTELGRVGKLIPEFTKRGVKPIALSVDSVNDHHGWVKDIEETQHTTISYPILADPDRHISNLYGMVAPNAPDTLAGKLTVRSVFVVDPSKKLRLTLTYPASTGRNFDEILRVVDSLQTTDNQKLATPADWKVGDPAVILPSVKEEEAQKLFPQGYQTVKPYLRLVNVDKK
jgi:alkyl hydroperoxide reductase subunit AhpC